MSFSFGTRRRSALVKLLKPSPPSVTSSPAFCDRTTGITSPMSNQSNRPSDAHTSPFTT